MSQEQNRRKATLRGFKSRANVTRRQFMERAAALGMGASMATGLWSSAARAAPSRGGHLKIGADGAATTDTMDPMKTIGTHHVTTGIASVYDKLFEIGSDGRPEGQLAESFEASNEGRTWRINLREGVQFHDGKPLTPEDVIYSLKYTGSEASTYADGQVTLGKIKEMKADGNAVVFELNDRNADFAFELSGSGFIIGPEGTEGQAWNEGNGTGPYLLETFEPGVLITGKKNPNYYRDDEAFVDSFELIAINDVNARTTALITGNVHLVSRPDPKITERLGSVADVQLISAEGNQHYTAPMRSDMAPFGDVNVRLAMKHLVNRQELLDKVLFGFGYIGNDLPVGRNQQFYNDELPQREHDPEKAKFYLEKAGLSSLDVTISAADAAFAGAVDAGVLIAEAAKEAGVNVTVERVPNDGYWSDVWLKKPWCFSYWSGRPTVGQILSAGYLSGGAWNESAFANDRFDKLVAEAQGELDEAKRQEMYFEAQEILYNESGSVIPLFASYVHAATSDLGHNGFRGNFGLDNNQAVRTCWLKA